MYQLRRPTAALLPYVEHYWFVTSSLEAPVDLRVDVFVDARADLIFNFGAPYTRTVIAPRSSGAGAGEARAIGTSNLDAQRLVPIRIEQRGLVRTTGVRFRLGGLAPFATIALREVTDRTPRPEEVLGLEARALEETLRAELGLDAQAAALDAFFVAQLARAPRLEGFTRALAHAVEARGGASVEEMAERAGVSSRHLDRLFAKHLGVPPKTLAKVLRFQCALGALMREPEGTLADVAATAGYFDQAHFIKDFRRMTGGVPRGYRGYYPPEGPSDFAPNVVVFLQDAEDVPA
ncbi:MAG: helix-turn-helix transcriptional regulator [Sandaracinus sp.]